MATRPTWAEVSLPALRHNFRLLRDLVGSGVEVCAVVKCDAYGHGLVPCAQALAAEGARWFGVTSTEEGVLLRDAGVEGRILLMTGFWRGEEDAVVQHALTPVVWDSEQLGLLHRAVTASAKSATAAHGARFPIHLKVDTGMGRLGLPFASSSSGSLSGILREIESSPSLRLEGLMTHLASAEQLDAPDLDRQLAIFDEVQRIFADARGGQTPQYIHAANSAAIVSRPRSRGTMVRPGISLYGYYLDFAPAAVAPHALSAVPHVSPAVPHVPDVKPVLSWKTRIMSVRDVPAGAALGYNARYVTAAPARIAALPVGYGDGLNRKLSSRGRVIVRGHYANMVGNISMDVTLIDITATGGMVGDEVVIIGEHAAAGGIGEQPAAAGENALHITAWDLARLADTIPYEVLCNISKRVPRHYIP